MKVQEICFKKSRKTSLQDSSTPTAVSTTIHQKLWNQLSLCPYRTLNEKGILKIEELDDRKKQVAERLVKRFVDSGLGLMYQDPEFDKYTFDKEEDVDCESRLDTYKAICCKLPFALSRQDVEEGIIR